MCMTFIFPGVGTDFVDEVPEDLIATRLIALRAVDLVRRSNRDDARLADPHELRVGNGRVAVVQIDHDTVPSHAIEDAVGDQGVLRAPVDHQQAVRKYLELKHTQRRVACLQQSSYGETSLCFQLFGKEKT